MGTSMGWWRIEGPTGGITWDSRGPDGAILANHVPGKDSAENYYNGDEPADILDKVLSTTIDRLSEVDYHDAVRRAFLGEGVSDTEIDLIHKQSLEMARERINKTYNREWGRDPCPEELSGLFEFCTAFIAPVPQ